MFHAFMLPSFMPLKGVGLEPSYRKRAVCLQRLGLQSSSGTGQGKGTGANQVAPTGPSSGQLWVLSLHCCLWLHLAQKESPGIWGRAEEGWNTSSLGEQGVEGCSLGAEDFKTFYLGLS